MEKKKYVQDDKHSREERMDLHGPNWLIERWTRAHDRVCPFTGRQVTLEDVEKGMYSLPRIQGDSAYGYEVYPTTEWIMEIFQKGMYSVLTSEYRKDFLEFVHAMDLELQSFVQSLNLEEATNNPA
jgi:hypothetical protein